MSLSKASFYRLRRCGKAKTRAITKVVATSLPQSVYCVRKGSPDGVVSVLVLAVAVVIVVDGCV